MPTGTAAICGNRINSINIAKRRNSHGTRSLVIFSIVSPDTLIAAYRPTPTDGVIRPKASAITMNTAKNSGSTPTDMAVDLILKSKEIVENASRRFQKVYFLNNLVIYK